ncbi:2-phosphosulfolactate phosphatase [Desulfotomaculum copahuensis]|uniref:Probable 2-phosphosulfolactate phosphatase n=1 Tax=Desulfotomaculum copahuensis TaxID=1838280 RepID=A0A1B7LCC0_9FIRM|nr:2-phosphosulfolactate phosphatase [Desulfotomaculum copahuensis]OAT80363.1 hypothetical protein A6M21_13410 [Desulfotomaculum copahuensis]
MKIDVVFTAGAIAPEELAGRTAVVFDVLRATSTIVTALANGCRAVVPVVDVDEAGRVAERLGQDAADGLESHGVLLAGERDGAKLPGFPHGNSPLEFGPEVIAGKTLVLTTTNGTRAIHGAAPAAAIYAGSLLNARAAAAAALAAGRDVTLVCAGTRERFSLEDTAAAGFVLMELLALAGAAAAGQAEQAAGGEAVAGAAGQMPSGSSGRALPAGPKTAGHSERSASAGDGAGGSFFRAPSTSKNAPGSAVRPELSDAALAALHLARAYRQNPLQIMYDSRHGQKLLGMGLAADLAWCARLNALDVVPVYRDGRLVL